MPPRIVFAGTPEFAVPTLRAVVAAAAEVPLVLTQPDRPAGRGRRVTASAVKQAAVELGLPVAQPQSLPAAAEGAAWLCRDRPDLMVVVAYGLLLPPWLLAWPRRGCLNVHASLLPRWRGAAPIQHAILAGDDVTGVSVMQMEAGLDTGPVFACRETPIGPDDTGGSLHDRLSVLGAELLAESLPRILVGELEPKAQDHARRTYAGKIDKADAGLDWSRPAEVLARRVRAFNPWPVTFTSLSDGRILRIFAAMPRPGRPAGAVAGDVVAAGNDGIDVAAGDGILRLTRVQPPSSRIMDAAAYLAAHTLEGVRFV